MTTRVLDSVLALDKLGSIDNLDTLVLGIPLGTHRGEFIRPIWVTHHVFEKPNSFEPLGFHLVEGQ